MNRKVPYDYNAMMKDVRRLSECYSWLEVTSIGDSVLGRGIPLLRIGDSHADAVLYVGTHHAMEWITSVVLMRFVEEFCCLITKGGKVFGIRPACVQKNRCLYFVPMLNPDGVELQIHGVDRTNPIKDCLIGFNGGSMDFTRWQANARGVDLNHNYRAGFSEYKKMEQEAGIRRGAPTRYSGEYPESEPEVSALCNFIRIVDNVHMILTLHTQGEEIYYTSGNKEAPSSRRIASLFEGMCGYTVARPEGMAAYGGLTDWFIKEFCYPSFTLECGKGQNPLPQSDADGIYEKIREVLFTAPLLI